VVGAQSVDEALAQLRDYGGEPPRFIVADYRLREGQTGTSAIDILRRTYGSQIPSVLVTGDTAVDRLRHAAASGLPIMHKPVNGHQLRDILERSLGTV